MYKRQIGIVMILALMFSLSAVTASAANKTITIRVKGMTWGRCAARVEQALKKTDGVIEASVSFEKGEAWIKYDDEKVTVAKLREVVNSTGFQAVEEKPTASIRRRNRKANHQQYDDRKQRTTSQTYSKTPLQT